MRIPKSDHKTQLGKFFQGDSVELLNAALGQSLKGKVQLILTSPPFPLNNKKSYGNLNGNEYKKWFIDLAPLFANLLTENGSIVIEMGNAWEHRRPIQSMLHLESLMGFVKKKKTGLRLIQQFICYNPSRLPSPAEWVTIRRIRLTDSFTHVWWIAKTDYPKADNKKVTRPYSKSMKKLIERNSFNHGERPSEHVISEKGFLYRHKGSIAHNVFELEQMDTTREVRLPNAFSLSNTSSNDFFSRKCRDRGITPHPARMPSGLVAFFVKLLTDPKDYVLDPFAGSNTTGYVAENLGRRWLSIETNPEYAKQSRIRLSDPILKKRE
ncbi:MAG: site-specific DNA-methyltransferase [Chloroflexi bacterium]|nr:site-specific DNA-methyltransferase [Chloroflexota bacterium]